MWLHCSAVISKDKDGITMIEMMNNETKTMKKTINVLLIEDNQADARLVIEYLKENENYNFNITTAESVKKAISIILKEGAEFFNIFDVVLLDLMLPDCMGITTLKKIKNELPGAPIIILSGAKLEQSDLRNCLESAFTFLVKGYIDPTILANAILTSIKKQKEHNRIMELVCRNSGNTKVNNFKEVVKNRFNKNPTNRR